MAATTITSTMLNNLRQRVVDMVSYAQYKIGGTWYRAEINRKEIRSNGSVHISFYIPVPASIETPASQFRLFDTGGNILAERTENVPFAQNIEKILFLFKFGVSVGSASQE